MTAAETSTGVAYLAAAVAFVTGLHQMRTPRSARRGNLVSASGMALALACTLWSVAGRPGASSWGWVALVVGIGAGAVFGAVSARRTPMTSVPQLVSMFNAVGGGAAATIALVAVVDPAVSTPRTPLVGVPLTLDLLIGGVTFTGSVVAAGKLQGILPGRSVTFPGGRLLEIAVGAVALAAGVLTVVVPRPWAPPLVLVAAALAFGILLVLPIGGADAPVVVSLLNAFTGLAVAFAGFTLSNQAMIIAGALVGAAGTILTLQMATAMNRSVASILLGGFGGAETSSGGTGVQSADSVRRVSADDVGLQLAYAHSVVIVPGYGLAAAQAQHEVASLARLLEAHGASVVYAIHPVAGRMPGHMNVLLAEVDVPYSQLLQLDEANRALERSDVALVLVANDVVNPAARRPGNAVSGMPILDVDHAKAVVVVKRSMSPGYAGIANDLFSDPRTGMLFADAKQGLRDIEAAVKQYVAP